MINSKDSDDQSDRQRDNPQNAGSYPMKLALYELKQLSSNYKTVGASYTFSLHV